MANQEHSTDHGAFTAVRTTLDGISTRGLLIVLLVLGPVACGGQDGQDESPALEAVDVAPSLEIDPSDDPRAAARGPELVGVLPESFPQDLPLFLSASLVDFGSRDGWRYVSLLTSASQSRVRDQLLSMARERGWSSSDGGDGVHSLRKGSRQVHLRIEDASPGTVYHFEYR